MGPSPTLSGNPGPATEFRPYDLFTIRHPVGPDAHAPRSRDIRARVPAADGVAERRVPADGQAARPARRPDRVLGLRADQLAAHDAVPEGLARPLRAVGPAGDRRARAGLLFRAR